MEVVSKSAQTRTRPSTAPVILDPCLKRTPHALVGPLIYHRKNLWKYVLLLLTLYTNSDVLLQNHMIYLIFLQILMNAVITMEVASIIAPI